MTEEKKPAIGVAPKVAQAKPVSKQSDTKAVSVPEIINAPAPKTIHDAMLEVQKSLKTIGKDKEAHKGKYASIKKIWEEIRETVTTAGFVVTHSIEAGGVRTSAVFSDEQSIESFVPFSTEVLKPQDKGSEITYYKRYNITAIFNIIIDEEDDDATSANTGGKFDKPVVDISGAIKKLRTAKNIDELKIFWGALEKAQRGEAEIEGVKEEMKNNFIA